MSPAVRFYTVRQSRVRLLNKTLKPSVYLHFIDFLRSAQNAAFTTNGYFYQGYQFQVKLLTPDDFSLNSSVISNNPENEQKPPAEVENPPEEKKPAPVIRKLPKKRKMPAIPEDGKPGSLSDPLRKGLSGAGTKWYLRYLEQGLAQKEARIKAEEHKYLALGHNQQTARKKAEQHYAHLFRTLKVLK